MSVAVSPAALRRANRWKLASLFAVLILTFTLLVTVENLLVSSLIAFVFSYTLGPVVNYLERQGISRRMATSSVFTLTVVVVGLLALAVAPTIGQTFSRLQDDMPRYIDGPGAVHLRGRIEGAQDRRSVVRGRRHRAGAVAADHVDP